MRFLQGYVTQLRNLFAGPESVDPTDVGSYLARRTVGRLMLAIPMIPLVLGGM